MPRGRFSTADREAVLADFRSGDMTVRQIADKHGISHTTVGKWAHDAGLSRTRGRKPSRTANRTDVMADWRDPELTITAICRKHGIGYELVVRWAQEDGLLELRKNGRQGRRKRKDESDFVLVDGAWVWGKDGVARWVPGATPQEASA